jgi:hypothetical protein
MRGCERLTGWDGEPSSPFLMSYDFKGIRELFMGRGYNGVGRRYGSQNLVPSTAPPRPTAARERALCDRLLIPTLYCIFFG